MVDFFARRAELVQGSRVLGSSEPGAFARELGIVETRAGGCCNINAAGGERQTNGRKIEKRLSHKLLSENRQHYGVVRFVEALHDESAIAGAVMTQKKKGRRATEDIYGDGTAGRKIDRFGTGHLLFVRLDTLDETELIQVGKASLTARARVQRQGALAEDPEPAWAKDLVETVAAGMAGPVFRARAAGHSACNFVPLHGPELLLFGPPPTAEVLNRVAMRRRFWIRN